MPASCLELPEIKTTVSVVDLVKYLSHESEQQTSTSDFLTNKIPVLSDKPTLNESRNMEASYKCFTVCAMDTG